jgi:2-amino-4-hydroxy-6-hydroxymethyldihydropteridine diphosphokinase
MIIPRPYAAQAMRTSYIIALGSNRPHGRHGAPERTVRAALTEIGLPLITFSRIIQSRPIGPSQRVYANAVALIETDLTPPALLDYLKAVERDMGRRAGQRWGARVIDLDIILWSGGCWESPGLTVPHPEFRHRSFVIDPLSTIAFAWRDPVTGLSIGQLKARLDRKRPSP